MAIEIGGYSDTYGPYQAAGTAPITPAPPSWSFNTQTRVLTLSHATLGPSELEFSYQNAAYQQYVAGLSVDGAAHPLGDWKGRVKAATGRNPSNVANSPAIQASTTPALPILLVFDGNSFLAGYDVGGGDVPAKITAILTQQGYNIEMRNFAIGGQSTRSMLQDAATQIDPLATAAGYSRHILFCTEWSNDVTVGNAPLAEARQSYIDYPAGRRAAGFEVVMTNILKRQSFMGNLTIEQFEAARLDENAFLAANWRTFADNLLDVTAATVSQPDGTHPDEAGYVTLSQLAAARIKEVIDGTVPGTAYPLPPAHYGTFSGNGARFIVPTNPAYKSLVFYLKVEIGALTEPNRGIVLIHANSDFSQYTNINIELPYPAGVVSYADGSLITQLSDIPTGRWATLLFEDFASDATCTILGSPIDLGGGNYLSVPGQIGGVFLYTRSLSPAERQATNTGVVPADFAAKFDFANATAAGIPDTKGGPAATFGTPAPALS